MWKVTDECKNAKVCRDQSKTEDKESEYKERYTTLDCKVKKSCHNDKKKCLDNKGDDTRSCCEEWHEGTVLHCMGSNRDKGGNILLNINEQDLHWIEHFKETLNQPDLTVTHNFSMDDSPKELTLNLGEITTNRDMGCNKSSEKQ